MKNFVYNLFDHNIKLEKSKARILRKSTWWKRKCDKGYCYYCKQKIPCKKLTMDHIVPISKGGKSIKGNIVPACKKCNNEKKQFLLMEWEEYLNKK